MKVLNLNILFKENAECLAKELGCNVVENFDRVENDETIYIFGGHTKPVELIRKQMRKKLNYVIIQTENIESDVFKLDLNYLNLLFGSTIWDWSYYNKDYLEKKYKFKIDKIYNFEFEKVENNLYPRNIDIFFCGAENNYRKELLSKIKKDYPKLKCFFSLNYNLTDPEQLNKILTRSKYILNIPYYSPSVLATHRINKALSCGCKVISEYSCDSKLDHEYKDKIIFTNDIYNKVGQIFEVST